MLSAANLTALDDARLRFIAWGPHHPGPRRPGGPLPLARGHPRRRPGHRHHHPQKRLEHRAGQEPQGRAGVGPAHPPRLMAGHLGLLQEARDPEQPDPHSSGQPRQGHPSPARSAPRARGPSPSIHQGDQVLDEASIARARSLVGLKGYVTNIPAHLMDAGEVVFSYHELWHVEQSFRMSKHDLRPDS